VVVQIPRDKNSHRRRQRTIRISIFVDVCNELRCWRSHLTGDLPEPKIKLGFKAQARDTAVNSYFSRLYPFACHRGHFGSGLITPLRTATERGLISAALAGAGHLNSNGAPFTATSVQRMLSQRARHEG
jgi:hypothetical protein